MIGERKVDGGVDNGEGDGDKDGDGGDDGEPTTTFILKRGSLSWLGIVLSVSAFLVVFRWRCLLEKVRNGMGWGMDLGGNGNLITWF